MILATDPFLTLKQLQCLLAVEETSHFRQAAERIGITQPSLSAQIQNLENVLGLQLVERNRSGVTLTPAGREVADHASRITDEVQSIMDFSAGARHGLSGTIRLGTSPTVGPYLLPGVVATLHKHHAGLNLYIREGATRDLEFELSRGIHDVILTQQGSDNPDFVSAPLFREPLYVALAADHPLADHETLAPEDLKGMDVLSLNPHYHLHDQVMRLCETFGARLSRDYEGTSLDALRQMVGMGMGLSFLPALYVQSEIRTRSEVVIKRMKGRSLTRSLALMWRKRAGRGEAYRRIADIIRDIASRKHKDLTLIG
ncbi:LysR family transcriptional regulator [Parvularcula flava]|uniref:LysR family transcriptional regulator n=2 Tax=Aquisalinus luteolus TaxID=1566827 RepID=A0ABX0HFL7_9PROT|nr:LysR family transcriptional regulator [Aquisalinus luteolus]